ncbi:hypothetical protein HNP46_006076 [Pseudomonas nitritireducens]|uniref:DUF4263 domain-containing protein n=1 Tax=Pseudomonas nitroreducens TaxID=46680 RepID=A0A7W7KRC5_PSENT|nr:hypothetical protein [Pseudomonas nitritireducens]MBB4867165.1 hypothetical protein [Pseudomonas nitritireducens]
MPRPITDPIQLAVVDHYERLIGAHRRFSRSNDLNVFSEKEPGNKIKKAGAKFQNRSPKMCSTSPAAKEEPTNDYSEPVFLKLIRDNPFLLRTPGLYSGGLYLGSIISELTIPHRYKRPDFVYITVQANLIKFTLVEIERPSRQIFTKNGFHEKSGVTQVKSWQMMRTLDDLKHNLLRNCSDLFEKYPVMLFDSSGKISRHLRIEIDFLLVTGREEIDQEWKRRLVDSLYTEYGIKLLTHPMMINEIKIMANTDANCLGVKSDRLVSRTTVNPTPLQRYLSKITNVDGCGARAAGFDTFLAKHAGLWGGFSYLWPDEDARKPANRLGVFYRSKGRCEHPGCGQDLCLDGVDPYLHPVCWDFEGAENAENLTRVTNLAVLCRAHKEEWLNRSILYGQQHELSNILARKWSYDFRGDVIHNKFISSFGEGAAESCAKHLGYDGEPDVIEELAHALPAFHSIPWQAQIRLAKLTSECYKISGRDGKFIEKPVTCRATKADEFLYSSGLLSALYLGDGMYELMPTALSSKLVFRILSDMGDRAWGIFHSLFEVNLRHLRQTAEQVWADNNASTT